MIRRISAWLVVRRKYAAAAIAPLIPVASHYLGGPVNVPAHGMWYAVLIGELAALGVYALKNEDTPTPPQEVVGG